MERRHPAAALLHRLVQLKDSLYPKERSRWSPRVRTSLSLGPPLSWYELARFGPGL